MIHLYRLRDLNNFFSEESAFRECLRQLSKIMIIQVEDLQNSTRTDQAAQLPLVCYIKASPSSMLCEICRKLRCGVFTSHYF